MGSQTYFIDCYLRKIHKFLAKDHHRCSELFANLANVNTDVFRTTKILIRFHETKTQRRFTLHRPKVYIMHAYETAFRILPQKIHKFLATDYSSPILGIVR